MKFEQITEQLTTIRALRKGFLTNFYQNDAMVNLWGRYDAVFGERIDDTFFIIRKNEGFWNLYYMTTTLDELEKTLAQFRIKYSQEILIVDIVGSQKNIDDLCSLFEKEGYTEYSSLVRMSKMVTEKEAPQVNVSYANAKDVEKINELLHQYFDPLCEQLPMREQIEDWVEKKHLLVFFDELEIVGFVIFDLIGVSSYIRYWFTHPNYREKKIGSQLLRQWNAESNDAKRQFFWVIKENENAKKRYHHYGFSEEEMYNKVLINKAM